MVRFQFAILVLGISMTALFPACKCSISTARLSDITTFKDKAHQEKTAVFGRGDMIFAKTSVEYNISDGDVEWRLIAKNVEGQAPNTVVVSGTLVQRVNGSQDSPYSITAPTKGWPIGTYTIEATLKVDGDEKDKKATEITVAGE